MMASNCSGWPKVADSPAKIRSARSASSKPPPKHRPWTATGQAALLFGVLGYFSGSIGAWLNRRPSVGQGLDRLAGTVFVALGVRMIASR
jgi:hypothetical protein